MGKKGPWSQGLKFGRRHSPTWSLLCLQMAQELGISEKSPDYRNPFKTDQSEVRWQQCWLILWASPSPRGSKAAGWGRERMAWWGTAKNPQHGGSLAKTCASNSPAGLWLVLGALCHLSHGSIGSLFA